MVALKRTLEKAGAEADLERAVPSLYRVDPDGKVKEAILDVYITTPGCLRTELVDVTVRCPHSIRADHGVGTAATTPSAAARDGELGKLLRYGPEVMPLALETYGRMGRASMDRLRELAATLSSVSVRSVYRNGAALLSAIRGEVERAK